jgi:hypothetical protein
VTISPEDFGRLFAEFEREAFRLETLDVYTIPAEQETFHAFKDGEPQPEAHKNAPWVSTVRGIVGSGRRLYRVHILRRPLTPYLQYELGWGYVRNSAAGEEFFILDITDRPNPLVGVPDFWMYDERFGVTMSYNEAGEFLGAERIPKDQTDTWLKIRDTAMAQAEPFAQWWELHGKG